MVKGDGLQRHRVSVSLEVEFNIFDNWTPSEAADLIGQILQNWAHYNSPDTKMVVWQRDAEVIEAEEENA